MTGGRRKPGRRGQATRPRPKDRTTSRTPARTPSRPKAAPTPAPAPAPEIDEDLDWEGEAWAASEVEDVGDDEAAGDEREPASPATVRALRQERGAPLIAIVGRPNVGKSRLFNRMTGTRFAIVEDLPGVTRDRQYGEGEYYGRRFQVVDTGGFEPDSDDVLLRQMREQAQLAIREADIIIHVVDGLAGILPADRDIAVVLRQTDRPVFTVVNKVDGPRHDVVVGEFYELGVDSLIAISAEHGRNYDDLMDEIAPLLPKAEQFERDDEVMRVAVLGKPNAGKSTLINQLLGEERLLTSDIPGTTRDAINTYMERDDGRYLLIDTAGIRRKRSIHEQVEKYAVVQAFKAIDRADVVLYVIDATEGVVAQDQRICGLVHDKGRALVLLLNKWDLVAPDHRTFDAYVKKLRDDLRFVPYAPVVALSALTGKRVHRLFPLVHDAFEAYTSRISTSKLNDWVRAALRRNPPKPRHNGRLKIFYVSQVATRPPTVMFSVNHPRYLHFSYERYLQNSFRRAFGFEGTPVKFFFREREQRAKDDEPIR